MRFTLRAVAMTGVLIPALAVPAVVLGHVTLIASSPPAGANLDAPPDEVSLTFDDELDPDLSSFTVTDRNGHEVGNGTVDLTVADRNVLRGDVAVADPGVYTVAYTVGGVDGHVLNGTFSFGYQTPKHQPDTALPAARPPSMPLSTLAGLFMIGAAALAAIVLPPRQAVRS